LNKHLEQLVKLSNFDKEIVGFEPQIQAQNDKLKVFMKTTEELSLKIENLYKEIDETKNKRIKNDLNMKDLRVKLDEISAKYDSVKTDKESRALQLEEEISKEQIAFSNDEIIRLDEITTKKEEELEELKSQLAAEEADVAELKEAIDKNIAELNASREAISKEKSELIETIDKKILSFYEKIRRWANETAVVPVKNQACYGCHMKLTNKVYSEFLVTDEITNCPHCGRIIYKETIEA
jgi:predicted  nucleic acid-binding Zn-ribbon protein